MREKNRVSVMRRLHRTLGASAAAFILFMALSGLAINHSQNLELERQHVSQPFLLRWYGIGEPQRVFSYAVNGNWVSFAGSQAYFNGNYISTLSSGVGAVFNGEFLVAAGGIELLILDQDGVLVEKMPWDQPGSDVIDSIGMLENDTVLIRSGGKSWAADTQLLQWLEVDSATTNAAWSEVASEPEEIRQAIIQQYRGAGLTMERLLLDVHSGRIFGTVGILVYDLLALIVGFLAISGIVFWIRGRRNGKNRFPTY